MKKFLMIAGVFVLATACNKNQQAVKKLDGTWEATKMEVTFDVFGTQLTIDLIDQGGSATMTFDGCKLKKDEWCTISSTFYEPLTDTTTVSNDLYRVTGDGTVLETKESDTSSTVTLITIVDLTKTDLKVTWTDEDLGGPIEAELKKK